MPFRLPDVPGAQPVGAAGILIVGTSVDCAEVVGRAEVDRAAAVRLTDSFESASPVDGTSPEDPGTFRVADRAQESLEQFRQNRGRPVWLDETRRS